MGEFMDDLYLFLLQIIKWFVTKLDRYDGACMVLLTAALVWFAYKSAKIALRNLEMIKRNDDKRSRPYVTLEVVNDMPFYGVRMVNFGATAAHNVIVKADPKIEMAFQRYRKPIGFLQEPVGYIAPSAHFETDIGTFTDIENANPSKVYKGTISFDNDEGSRFEHEFVLDFTPYTDTVHKDEKTIHHVAKELEELRREIQHIATGFHKPHVLIEDFNSYQEKERKWIEDVRRRDRAEIERAEEADNRGVQVCEDERQCVEELDK